MRFWTNVGVVLLLLTRAGAVRADVINVERVIQLPGGRPAAGAKVLLRSLNLKDGTLKQEKRVVADDQGVVRAEIEVDGPESLSPVRAAAYLVVDSPGMALAFENFRNWQQRRDVEPLVLSAGYEIKGKIVTGQGEPVGDAEIALAAFLSNWSDWRINYPSADIVTPEAITRSRADGSFEMRAVDIIEQTGGNGPPVVRPMLVVRAIKDGIALSGSSESAARLIGAPTDPDAAAATIRNTIVLLPSATVRGRVLDTSNGQPIAGAKINLRAVPGNAVAAEIRAVTSGPDGSFEFQGVPASFQLFAEANHPDFGNGWTRIGEERNRLAADAPRVYENAEIRLRPWATVIGRVLETLTKAPPATPVSIQVVYDEGFNDGNIGVGRGGIVGRVSADGTFTMKMPVGPNHILVRGQGYRENAATDLDVKPEGETKLQLSVRREKGFLVRFSAAAAQGQANYDFDREYDLHIRGADGQESSTSPSEWWYWPLYKPEDTMEIRVTRSVDGFSQEVVPWTKLIASADVPQDANWPRQIHLPLRQFLTVRGKVVDGASGQAIGGAIVQLLSNPAVATRNFAPIASGADGSFAFTNVPLASELLVRATLAPNHLRQADLAEGWARVGNGQLSAVTTNTDLGQQDIKDIALTMPPLITVTGQLVDAETNAPALLPTGSDEDTAAVLNIGGQIGNGGSRAAPRPLLTLQLSGGTNFLLPPPDAMPYENLSLKASLLNAPVAVDGRFTLRLPVGEHAVSLDSLYKIEAASAQLKVLPTGLKNVVIKAQRQPSIALRLTRANPELVRAIAITFVEGGNEFPAGRINWNTGPAQIWTVSVPQWGTKKQLRIVDELRNIELWVGEVTADPKTWPLEIELAEKP